MKLFSFGKRAPEENSIAGEREIAPLNKGLGLQNRALGWGGIMVAFAVALFVSYRVMATQYRTAQAATEPQKDTTRTADSELPPLVTPKPAAHAEEAPPPLQQPSGSAAAATQPGQNQGTTAPSQPPLTPQEEKHKRQLSSPLLFAAADGVAGAAQPAPGGDVATVQPVVPPATEPKQAVPGSFYKTARAYRLADPSLMITVGDWIPCGVLPAMDTTLSGPVTCVQERDARSADRKVVLLPAGTLWTGYQAGGLALGQRRVGIIWRRLETPEHVLMDIDAPAADALGRPGIPGTIDTHFWDRFGAAIALSLISDVGSYLAATRNQSGNNNTSISFPVMSGGAQDVMAEVFKHTIDIPPTLTAPHASRVMIYVAQDMDFRDVYSLERAR
jgi:type IV secretion system protein VirB10